jgi:NlpC/P60 family putative phage cell wall peptidase
LSAAQRAAVCAEAREWIGTPYHPNARLKGVGTDCAMLLAEVYERVGVIPRVDPGVYSSDHAFHSSEEQLAAWFDRYATETDTPQPGDAVIFRFGRCYSHAAIYTGAGSIVHAVKADRMVVAGMMTDGDLPDRAPRFFTLWGA